MLRVRRGAILLLVLGVATVVLALLGWGTYRVAWSRGQTRAEWDRVVLDFAAVEVERAAREASVARPGSAAIATLVTTNRLIGRVEVRTVAPEVWWVRWSVGGADGLWREGGWLALESAAPVAAGVGVLTPLPGLPPVR